MASRTLGGPSTSTDEPRARRYQTASSAPPRFRSTTTSPSGVADSAPTCWPRTLQCSHAGSRTPLLSTSPSGSQSQLRSADRLLVYPNAEAGGSSPPRPTTLVQLGQARVAGPVGRHWAAQSERNAPRPDN